MPIYQVYDYDVWGNSKDGFEVNNIFKTPYKVNISEKDTDHQIIGKLKNVFFLQRYAKNSKFRIEGEPDFTLYVVHEPAEYPVCELRRL